jgi:hypothetical protein
VISPSAFAETELGVRFLHDAHLGLSRARDGTPGWYAFTRASTENPLVNAGDRKTFVASQWFLAVLETWLVAAVDPLSCMCLIRSSIGAYNATNSSFDVAFLL